MILRILLGVLCLYFILVFLAYALQRKLLYFPERNSIQAVMSLAEQFDLKLWPTRDSRYRGFISKIDRIDYSGTVIIFHGNAGSAIDRSYYVKPLARLG